MRTLVIAPGFISFAFQIYFFYSVHPSLSRSRWIRPRPPFVVNHFRAPRQGRLLLPSGNETVLAIKRIQRKGLPSPLPAEHSGTRASAIARFAANSRPFPPCSIDSIESRTPLSIHVDILISLAKPMPTTRSSIPAFIAILDFSLLFSLYVRLLLLLYIYICKRIDE